MYVSIANFIEEIIIIIKIKLSNKLCLTMKNDCRRKVLVLDKQNNASFYIEINLLLIKLRRNSYCQ